MVDAFHDAHREHLLKIGITEIGSLDTSSGPEVTVLVSCLAHAVDKKPYVICGELEGEMIDNGKTEDYKLNLHALRQYLSLIHI